QRGPRTRRARARLRGRAVHLAAVGDRGGLARSALLQREPRQGAVPHVAPGLTAAPPPRAAREHARPACQRRAAPAEGKPRERSPEPAAGGLAAARRLLRLQTVNLLIKMLGL